MRTRFLLASAVIAVALAVTGSSPQAQAPSARSAANTSDLDAFMKQVLSRRDENWKKLQQYTLEEEEVFQVTAMSGRRFWGFKREYSWYPREDGLFVRSPITADGVKVSEEDRRAAEARWIKQEEGRDKARQKRDEERASQTPNSQTTNSQDSGKKVEVRVGTDADNGVEVRTGNDGERAPGLNDLVKPGNEPRFVSSAYFMKFKFDEGSYALAGREKLLGRDVLKIEYYPHQYFRDQPKDNAKKGGDPKKSEKDRITEDKIERKMDKVSMITLWIEPADHQILQYEFTNIDFDFLPGRSLVRLDDLRASMRMREAFPQVWLPDAIGMSFGMTLALGDVGARYDVKYHDYKLAEVKTRVR